jgi:hypothetical protein
MLYNDAASLNGLHSWMTIDRWLVPAHSIRTVEQGAYAGS